MTASDNIVCVPLEAFNVSLFLTQQKVLIARDIPIAYVNKASIAYQMIHSRYQVASFRFFHLGNSPSPWAV